MYAGLLFGIYTLTSENYMEYGVIILFLYQMSTVAQLALRYFISFQTYMVNAERAHTMTVLEHEAALETNYDREQGISNA